jgi:hypothetical protein
MCRRRKGRGRTAPLCAEKRFPIPLSASLRYVDRLASHNNPSPASDYPVSSLDLKQSLLLCMDMRQRLLHRLMPSLREI